MADTRVLSVSEVTAHVKRLLEQSEVLQRLEVRGEVSSFKRHTSGHLYFSLRDEHTQLSCVCFRGRAAHLDFEPQDGQQVVASGYVSVYERGGRYQLYVQSLRPDGLGELYLAFERLRAKLESEGLFDPARKRALPRFPSGVALVTSPTGAAVRDLVTILRRRFPPIGVVVVPTTVQGPEAPAAIRQSLETANAVEGVDVVVVARGGGSMEDLWCFNDETVARAVFASPRPVVSAVGHETDFTIIDFVADLRAPTPSAAAELVVPDVGELQETIAQFAGRAASAVWQLTRRSRDQVGALLARPVLRRPEQIIWDRRQQVDDLVARGDAAMRGCLQASRARAENALARVEALSPRATLRRGYSVTRRTDDGALIRSVAQVESGLGLTVAVADGAFGATAE